MLTTFPRQLGLAMVLVQAIAVAVAAFAILALHSATRTSQQLIEHEASELLVAERLRATTQRQAATLRGFLLSGDPSFLRDREAAERTAADQLESLRRGAEGDARAHLDELAAIQAEHRQAVRQMLTGNRSKAELAREFETEVLPRFRQIDGKLAEYAEQRRASYVEVLSSARDDTHRSSIAIAGIALVGFLASSWLAVAFGRRLKRSGESEREATRVAEAAVTARQDLLGAVAHDLRSPLAAIALKSHLIARSVPGESQVAGPALAIQRVASRLGFLIASLLDAASIEAGGLKLERRRFAVRSLLDATVEVFAEQASARRIALERASVEASLFAEGDYERLLQVLSNLVGNALKFTPEGGRIRLSCLRTGSSVRFEVADTGPGIPPDEQPRIFDRYWKRDAAAGRGTGLGLFIARRIVETHGGTLRVESEPGAGARFFFRVPATDSDAEQLAARPEPDASARASLEDQTGAVIGRVSANNPAKPPVCFIRATHRGDALGTRTRSGYLGRRGR